MNKLKNIWPVILSYPFPSQDFAKKHSTTPTSLKVRNYITEPLDNKQCCPSLFIDFSKAFDTMDHDILIEHLTAAGFSVHAVGWFANYLNDRTQAVQLGVSSEVQFVHMGVPQGSVLGPLLFTLYINDIGVNIPNAAFHFYADDNHLLLCTHACRSVCTPAECIL